MNQEQQMAALNAMSDWLMDPVLLGKRPSFIECVGSFELDGLVYYKIIFKGGYIKRTVSNFAGGLFSFLEPLASFLDNMMPAAGPWYLGVVGGYEGDNLEHSGYLVSWMEEYNESTADERAVYMLKTFMENTLKNRGPASNEPYNENEVAAIRNHIETYFGHATSVIYPEPCAGLTFDIYVVPPEGERDYYTLVTVGFGSYSMRTPAGVDRYKCGRVELMIGLPDYWQIDNESMKESRWEWPIYVLKIIITHIIENSQWLHFGYGAYLGKLDESTDLDHMLIVEGVVPEGGDVCKLPSGTPVNFLQVIPLYKSEADFYNEYGLEKLLDKMSDVSFVIDPKRPSAV